MGQKPDRPKHARPTPPGARPKAPTRPPVPAEAQRPGNRVLGIVAGVSVGVVAALAISVAVVAAMKFAQRRPGGSVGPIAQADSGVSQPDAAPVGDENGSDRPEAAPDVGPPTNGPLSSKPAPAAKSQPAPAPPIEPPRSGGAQGAAGAAAPQGESSSVPVAPAGGVPAGGAPATGAPAGTGVPAGGEPASSTVGRRALDDLRSRHRRLPLPDSRTAGDAPRELAKIYVDAPAKCELRLLGVETALGASRRIVLARSDTADGARQWSITVPSGMVASKGTAAGVFELRGESLSYVWRNRSAVSLAAGLAQCLLEIEVGEDKERCTLAPPPQKCEPISVSLDARAARQELRLNCATWPDVALLRYEVRPDFAERFEVQPEDGVKPGEPSTVRILSSSPPAGGGVGQAGFELEVRLELEDSPSLNTRVYVNTKEMRPDGRITEKRTPLSRRWLEDQRKRLQDNQGKLRNEQKKAADQLEGAKGELQRIDGMSSSSRYNAAAGLELLRRRVVAEQTLENAEQLVAAGAAREAYYNGLGTWLDELQKLFDRVQGGVKLHLVVYQEVERERILLATTHSEDI